MAEPDVVDRAQLQALSELMAWSVTVSLPVAMQQWVSRQPSRQQPVCAGTTCCGCTSCIAGGPSRLPDTWAAPTHQEAPGSR